MRFLCPNHRHQLAELPLEERKKLWLFWMENAHVRSVQEQWQDVISLSGSAFDLACLHAPRDNDGMHIELTLSAILVTRALSNLGHRTSTDAVTLRALECLEHIDHQSSSGQHQDIQECIAALIDPSRHTDFFTDYLNWPPFPFGSGEGATMARTLH